MFKFKDKDIYSTEDIKQMIDDNFYFWKNLLDDYRSETKELKERISELETEAGKEDYINEELSKLRKENDNLNKNLRFKISDYNFKLIENWQTQHLSEFIKIILIWVLLEAFLNINLFLLEWALLSDVYVIFVKVKL